MKLHKQTRVSSIKLFFFIFVIRTINSLSIQTFFQADEFYQSLEPAHYFTYGYGYLTWEWEYKLRSSIQPLIYVFGYTLAGENKTLIYYIPKLINALVASLFDFSLYGFILNYSKSYNLAWTGLILSIFNAFNWFVLTRSFSNNLEACFTTLALKYWPWNKRIGKSWYICLIFITLSCIIRPTNAIFWLPFGFWLLYLVPIGFKFVLSSIAEVVLVLIANLGADYYFYREITFPYFNFIEFNYIKNLASFYGVAPWHFYISQALPLMLLTYIPIFLCGLEKSILLVTCIIYIVGFSTIKHKEFRFLMPLSPIFLYFAARGYKKWKWKYLSIIGIFINVVVALFLSNINERGAIDVVNYLGNKNADSVFFMTPCHSFPWQSSFHNKEIQIESLTCLPPLDISNPSIEELKNYRDESDVFYDDIDQGILNIMNQQNLPTYIVIFQGLENLMDQQDKYYQKEKRFFNSYFHWDDRRKGDVILYKKINNKTSK
ncbi:GPI10 [Candida jiufengensis]|uniref:GPI10 n=1 Tax=Candida jiufengensis TaxID=497108 RepID=UPI002224A32D|nr:GPI10 [Candida jiufengensis]KAI5950339.1 GPI10 [Candida jiufengensis]